MRHTIQIDQKNQEDLILIIPEDLKNIMMKIKINTDQMDVNHAVNNICQMMKTVRI